MNENFSDELMSTLVVVIAIFLVCIISIALSILMGFL